MSEDVIVIFHEVEADENTPLPQPQAPPVPPEEREPIGISWRSRFTELEE